MRKLDTTRHSARMSPPPPLLFLLVLLILLCPTLRADDDASAKSGMRGHLEAFGKQGPSSDIDQVDGFLPPRKFVENYVMQNRPILFKGAAKLSPAFTKWTDQYLMSTAPPRPAGDVFIEHSKKENRSQPYNFVHLKTFLETYNTSNIYMVSDVPDHLLKDLLLPYCLQCKGFMQGYLETNVMWFSSGGTSSVIHNDSFENINCLYRGRKRIVFVDSNKFSERVAKILDMQDGTFSSVDVDKIDLVERPEFRDLEFHTVEMNTGDCVYIPDVWIHQVRSLDSNLAVNIWWPKRIIYNLTICAEVPSTKIHFGKAYFKKLEKKFKNEVNDTRTLIKDNLLRERTEADLLHMLSRGNARVAAVPEFARTVSALFKSLDLDMDGSLSDKELTEKLKRRQYRPIHKAMVDFNVMTHRLNQEASSNSKEFQELLPKLLPMGNSDAKFYASHKTWQKLPQQFMVDDADLDDPELFNKQPPQQQVPSGSDERQLKSEL